MLVGWLVGRKRKKRERGGKGDEKKRKERKEKKGKKRKAKETIRKDTKGCERQFEAPCAKAIYLSSHPNGTYCFQSRSKVHTYSTVACSTRLAIPSKPLRLAGAKPSAPLLFFLDLGLEHTTVVTYRFLY